MIYQKYGISFHLYADDAQLYLPFEPNDTNALGALHACIQELKLWLTKNYLILNEGKTKVILFGDGLVMVLMAVITTLVT